MSIRTATIDGVCTIEIARPEKKNALTLAMYDAMTAALEGAWQSAECALLNVCSFFGESPVRRSRWRGVALNRDGSLHGRPASTRACAMVNGWTRT